MTVWVPKRALIWAAVTPLTGRRISVPERSGAAGGVVTLAGAAKAVLLLKSTGPALIARATAPTPRRSERRVNLRECRSINDSLLQLERRDVEDVAADVDFQRAGAGGQIVQVEGAAAIGGGVVRCPHQPH